MHQLISYIKFLLKSTNQHGVHSPFIFDLVTKCLYDKTAYPEYDQLKTYRQHLKGSSTVLEIKDLGMGSKRLPSTKRKVSSMVNTSSSSIKTAQLLFRLSHYLNCKNALELGTSLGMATYAITLGQKEGQLTSIEGCPNTSNFAKQQLDSKGISNVEYKIGDFTALIPSLQTETYDLIFFDGHHQKAATLNYFNALLPKAHNDSVFIFDDIYWSKGMTEAWEMIKAHPKVTVTVDTFQLGLVFFRSQQQKQHFKIRV
ncbi:O-methyltransferase [Winogradskyella sp. A3E31]|uniref:O-methyltransferase n=1 Tax=Winogradskyella sp. A3E31 TaxID=3349637 RepID=UPI00398A675A